MQKLIGAMAQLHESTVFSVAVLGLGMIGSAACRHLSLASESVVGIGPPEPADWEAHTGVFASHYDEGRITRIVDKDPVWSKLAARSIASYSLIEEESGICFHHPVGSLRVTPLYKQVGDSLPTAFEVGKENGAAVQLIDGVGELKQRFPYFHFESNHAGVVETGGAGYVNPRAMVKAQLAVAKKHGAYLVPETVIAVETSSNGVTITTDGGKVLSAFKVLICADAYSNYLLPSSKLVLETKLVSVLLAEIGEKEEKRLQGMPSIIWRLDSHPTLHSIYACPPIRYPDGKSYLKIGDTEYDPLTKSSHEDFVKWFHGEGGQAQVDVLQSVLLQLIPDLSYNSLQKKPCIVTYTSHGYPYIDAVDGKQASYETKVFVATGGCGAAAKSSDEIGRIGALLVSNGNWNYDLDKNLFKAVFMEDKTELQAAI